MTQKTFVIQYTLRHGELPSASIMKILNGNEFFDKKK